MAFFEDLTPYTYCHPEEEPVNTLNVGWLEFGHPFQVGETSAEFRVKLGILCQNRVKKMRGFQTCGFCESGDNHRSSAEIRVAIRDRVFAAPELIHHYVVAHDYLPPAEFIEAVLASSDPMEN